MPNGVASISPDGTLSVNGAVAGKLQVVDLSAGAGLSPAGSSYYSAPEGSAQKAQDYAVTQGMLESSNVNAVASVVNLIAVQTARGNAAARLVHVLQRFQPHRRGRFAAGLKPEAAYVSIAYTAASGMIAQQLNLDNIANNLANSSTSGFRKRRVQFQDLLYQNMVMPGSASSQQTTTAAGLQIGLGTRSAASEIIQTQGDFSSTGNPLEPTVEGPGFFQVTLPTGERLTRAAAPSILTRKATSSPPTATPSSLPLRFPPMPLPSPLAPTAQ